MAKIGDRFVRRTSRGLIISELKVVKVNEKSMYLEDYKGKIYRKANSDKKVVTIKPSPKYDWTESYYKLED